MQQKVQLVVIPEAEPEERNTEIENFSVKIDQALVEFEQKIDHNKLIEVDRQVTQSQNSVRSVKSIIQAIFS